MLTPEERHQKELAEGIRTDIRRLADALHEHAQELKSSHASADATYSEAQDTQERLTALENALANRNRPNADAPKNKWTSFEKWYFAVQCLLFFATFAAFCTAFWYAKIADQQKSVMNGQWAIMIAQWNTMAKTLDEIQKQTGSSQVSASAARSAANTAANSLELSERPWISVDVAISGPVVVSGRRLTMSVATQTRNIGHSVAVHVVMRSNIAPGTIAGGILKEQDRLCRATRFLSATSGNTEDTVFPDKQGTGWNMQYSINEFFGPSGTKNIVVPYIVGCVDYQANFAARHYQTGFVYQSCPKQLFANLVLDRL